MKNIYLFMLLVPAMLLANPKIDSLKNLLNFSQGIEKVDILNKLGNLYLEISVDKSLEYSKAALEISKSLNYTKGIAIAKEFVGSALLLKKDFRNSLKYLLDAIKYLDKTNDGLYYAHCLGLIGKNYFYLNKVDSAIFSFKELLNISRIIKNLNFEAFALQVIGTLNYKIRKFSKTLEYHLKALKIYRNLGYKKEIASICNSIGSDYCALSYYDKSIDYYLIALSLFEEIGDQDGIFISYHAMGMVYEDLRNYKKSLKYNFTALKLRNEISANDLIASCLTSIGLAYLHLEKYDSSLAFSWESLSIDLNNYEKSSVVLSYDNIGKVYFKLGDYKKALYYYQEGLNIAQINSDKWLISKILNSIGNVYIKMKYFCNAHNTLKKSFDIATSLRTKDLIQNSYKSFSDYYATIGKYKMAFKYLKLFTNLRDSVFTENSNRIADMQTRYETNKRQKENEILKRNNSIQKLQIEKQNLIKWRLYFILGLILLIVVLIYYRYLVKIRINKEQQQIIFHQASLTSLGELTATLAHEITQPLQSICLSTEAAQLELREDHPDNKVIDINLNDISSYISRINYVIDHIRVFSSQQKENVNEDFDVNSAITNAYYLVERQLSKHNIQVTFDLNNTMRHILGNPFKLEQVLLNLISNAQDALEEKASSDLELISKEIKIRSYCNNNEIIVSVEDNGIGIPLDIKKDVFRPFFSSKKLGHGSGLGLSISRHLVKEMDGTIDIDSRQFFGTKVLVRFPNNKKG